MANVFLTGHFSSKFDCVCRSTMIFLLLTILNCSVQMWNYKFYSLIPALLENIGSSFPCYTTGFFFQPFTTFYVILLLCSFIIHSKFYCVFGLFNNILHKWRVEVLFNIIINIECTDYSDSFINMATACFWSKGLSLIYRRIPVNEGN